MKITHWGLVNYFLKNSNRMVHHYGKFKGLFTPRENECESEKEQTKETNRKSLSMKEICRFPFQLRLVWMGFNLWGWLCTWFCNRFSQMISMRSSLSFCSSKTANISSSSASFSAISSTCFVVSLWSWSCLAVVSLWPWPCVCLFSFWFLPIVRHEFPADCSSDTISTE